MNVDSIKQQYSFETKLKRFTRKQLRNIVITSFIVIAVFFTFITLYLYSNSNAKVQVPNLVGKDINKAAKLLKEQGLEYEIDKYESALNTDVDVVLSQDTKEDTIVNKGTVIHIKVCNEKLVQVPKVIDISLDEALEILEQSGLNVEYTEEFSDKFESGNVIEQDIKSETQVTEGSVIHIVLSKGKENKKMPYVVGEKYTDVKELLQKYEFKITIKKVYSESVKKGYIISQSIKKNTEVAAGDKLVIKISKGAKPVETQTQKESQKTYEYPTAGESTESTIQRTTQGTTKATQQTTEQKTTKKTTGESTDDTVMFDSIDQW